MNALMPSWSVQEPCEETIQILEQRLSGAGLRLMRTFDLHAARLAATAECRCPHHGTADCDCQMVVLLVYADAPAPVTLVVHGNNGCSWISIIDNPNQRASPATILAIQRALQTAAASEV